MPTATRHKRSNQSHSSNNHMNDLRQHAADIGHSVRAMAATAGSAAEDRLSPVEDYVREQPMKSMLFALLAGALLGAIFLRR